jgi:hypothetical protein
MAAGSVASVSSGELWESRVCGCVGANEANGVQVAMFDCMI